MSNDQPNPTPGPWEIATIAGLQSKLDAAEKRVAELERENERLTKSLEKTIGKKSTLITSKLPQ